MLEEKNDNLQEADGIVNPIEEIVELKEKERLESNHEDANDLTKDATVAVEIEEATASTMLVEENAPLIEQEPVKSQDEVPSLPASESPLAEEVAHISEIQEEEPTNLITIESTDEAIDKVESISTLEEEDHIPTSSELDEEQPIATVTSTKEISNIEQESSEFIEEHKEEEKPKGDLEHHDIISEIANANATESEEETVGQALPMEDYDSLSMEALVAELEAITASEKVMAVKDHVEEIKRSFLAKYHHFIDEKRDEFHAENPDTTEDFHYSLPLKTKFDQIYSSYRDRKNKHFKSLESNLKSNLETRLGIVDELKNLINPQENIKDTLKQFNELRERWKNTGPIPKDKYNHVWNNYHFHVENFYDYLHLDREARDIDFKHNLEQKLKIIARVEALIDETDINKAFRELQDLHRIWKEDIGPVSREHREEVWNKFSDLTKQMHDKRESLYEEIRAKELQNLERKKEIITQIETLAQENVSSHAAWTAQVAKVEAARNDFFGAGKVPSELNEEVWAQFKNAVRSFNILKNSFYKEIKKDQNTNLSRKQALVAKAKELQESTDYAATTPLMKQIQEEWKQIGHVPRKYSDLLWNEFRAACNGYFEKLKELKKEENSEEIEAFENKKNYLESLKTFEMTGNHKTDLDAIKLHIENWKGFGKVPFSRRHVEGKFNKILDALFEKLSLSKKETDLMRFSNRMENLSDNNDQRKIENEKIFIQRKIEELQHEIFQLENNIQFFTNTKNAKKENSIVLEVRKNIAIHKENLQVWKEKLKKLRNLKQE